MQLFGFRMAGGQIWPEEIYKDPIGAIRACPLPSLCPSWEPIGETIQGFSVQSYKSLPRSRSVCLASLGVLLPASRSAGCQRSLWNPRICPDYKPSKPSSIFFSTFLVFLWRAPFSQCCWVSEYAFMAVSFLSSSAPNLNLTARNI